MKKIDFPLPKDVLCQVWLKLAKWFLKEDFLILWMYFRYFVISPLGNRRGFSFEQMWIPLTQWCNVQFCLNCPNGSGEDDFLILSCIFASALLSFFGKGRGTWFEQTWNPITQRCFMPFWLKLAQWFLRRQRKCEKFTTTKVTTTTTADNGHISMKKANLNFQFRWAKKEIGGHNCWCVV